MSAFESNNSQETPDQKPAATNAFEDQLKAIKNEAGEQKYDTLEKALDALKHSQSYIPDLKSTLTEKEQEIARLQEELSKRSAVEDVVAKLTANQDQQETTPQANGLDEQAVLNLVQDFTQQQQVAQSASANEKSVSDALFSTYGDKTQEVVSTKAAELGMSVDELRALSQKSPQAALSLFQVQGSSMPKSTSGSINIPPNAPVEDVLAPPEKSLLRGASTKEQVEYMRKIRDTVYKKHNVTV